MNRSPECWNDNYTWRREGYALIWEASRWWSVWLSRSQKDSRQVPDFWNEMTCCHFQYVLFRVFWSKFSFHDQQKLYTKLSLKFTETNTIRHQFQFSWKRKCSLHLLFSVWWTHLAERLEDLSRLTLDDSQRHPNQQRLRDFDLPGKLMNFSKLLILFPVLICSFPFAAICQLFYFFSSWVNDEAVLIDACSFFRGSALDILFFTLWSSLIMGIFDLSKIEIKHWEIKAVLRDVQRIAIAAISHLECTFRSVLMNEENAIKMS